MVWRGLRDALECREGSASQNGAVGEGLTKVASLVFDLDIIDGGGRSTAGVVHIAQLNVGVADELGLLRTACDWHVHGVFVQAVREAEGVEKNGNVD